MGKLVNIEKEVLGILDQVLGLNGRGSSLKPEPPLLGVISKHGFSMAVVSILTRLEEHFGVTVEDAEISADTFATLGTLTSFVGQKLG